MSARTPPPRVATATDQLRSILAARGLTGYQIAKDSGVDVAAISRFLNGKRSLSLESLDRLTLAYGLKILDTGRGRSRKSPHSTETN